MSGEGRLGVRKGSAPECSGHGTGWPGQWARPQMLEFKKCQGNDLGLLWSLELDSVIPWVPYSSGYSMVLWFYVAQWGRCIQHCQPHCWGCRKWGKGVSESHIAQVYSGWITVSTGFSSNKPFRRPYMWHSKVCIVCMSAVYLNFFLAAQVDKGRYRKCNCYQGHIIRALLKEYIPSLRPVYPKL